MGKVLTAIAAMMACVSVTASAQMPPAPPEAMPPVQYRALGGVPVVFVPSADMWRACGAEPRHGTYLYACARVLPNNQIFIVMPDPCETAAYDTYALVMCHELAHANGGWPSNHPQ